MTLQNDYRPDSFDNFIGNKTLVKNLQTMIENEKLPNAILFSGESRCGKTTLARILASELNCSSHDLYEYNSSNTRGIDTAREIINSLQYKPFNGSVKFYILDETHMTTKDFQNAMLKAIEEPPSYVHFILCTTDPGKLITTIRKRCTHFTVSRLSDKEMLMLLRKISRAEEIKFDKEIYEMIIEQTEGCPGDAVKILDKIRDIDDNELIIECIKEDSIDEAEVIDLCRALLDGKSWSKIAPILKGIKTEPETVRRAVLGYMSAVLLNNNKTDRVAMIMECFEDHFYDTGKSGLVLACYRTVE